MPELVGSRLLDLDVLPPAEARALFGRVAGEDRASAEPAATDEVLAACAGLPLAIRIAGARLAARGGWNVRTLAGRLSDERRRLDELRAGNLAVRASLRGELRQPGRVRRAGRREARPAPSACWACGPGPSIALPAAAALLGQPEQAVADALEVLVDAHLLDSPEPDVYRFHDLLRVYAADRARAQETEQDRQDAVSPAAHLVPAHHRGRGPGHLPAAHQGAAGSAPWPVRPLEFAIPGSRARLVRARARRAGGGRPAGRRVRPARDRLEAARRRA